MIESMIRISLPTFADTEEYLIYKKGVMDFIKARNKRIDNYANKQTTEQNASRQHGFCVRRGDVSR